MKLKKLNFYYQGHAQKESTAEVKKASSPISFGETFKVDSSAVTPFKPQKKERKEKVYDHYSFDNFITDDHNKITYLTVKKILQDQTVLKEKTFPFIAIHGKSGSGKSHLVRAFYNLAVKKKEAKILFFNAQEFLSQFVEHIRSNSLQQFKENINRHDTLIIEDIDQLKGKKKTQDELFYILKKFYENKKQIILTLDVAPLYLEGFNEKITNLLSNSISLNINFPGVSSRKEIIKKIGHQKSLFLCEQSIDYVAQISSLGVRQIKGYMNKLNAYSSLFNINLDFSMVKNILKVTVKKKPSTEELVDQVSSILCVSKKELFSAQKTRRISIARQILIYLLHQEIRCSIEEIQKVLNIPSTSSVYYALKKVQQNRKKYLPFLQKIEEKIFKEI